MQRLRISTPDEVGSTTSTKLILLSSLSTRLVAEAACLHHLAERLPQHVSQKANQNMSQHAVFFLMPDRSDSQVAFFDAKRGFGLGQLNIRLPKFLRRPIGDVRSQQVTTFRQSCPILP